MKVSLERPREERRGENVGFSLRAELSWEGRKWRNEILISWVAVGGARGEGGAAAAAGEKRQRGETAARTQGGVRGERNFFAKLLLKLGLSVASEK